MRMFGSFGLDTANACLWREGVQIELAPRPFAVLRYLVENPGRLITHDELLDKLWPETFVQPQVLRTYMLELRKVLGDDVKEPRYIQTLPKRGYRFVAAIRECAEPISAAGSRGPVRVMADRLEEISRLRVHAQIAASGQRQVVFITGENGIGKTTLVDAFCTRAASEFGMVLIRGQCVRGFGVNEPYYPVMEALGQLCASADGERMVGVLSRMAPGWLRALGREADASTAHLPVQQRMAGDLCAAIEEFATDRTVLFVFEDVHWADSSTLDLISALARRRATARLMVVATFRPLDSASTHPLKELKQDLLIRKLCVEIALAPLSRSAVNELIQSQIGSEAVPGWLPSFVYRHSEGNPLFATAILEHLIAQGLLTREDERGATRVRFGLPGAEMDAAIPSELAGMIELEIQNLSAKEQRILEAGSLIAIAFPTWAVAAAIEADLGTVEDECEELARRLHFVHRAGQDELPDGTHSAFYAFAHELFREVLMRRMPAARRAAMHVRIAERLGELFRGRVANVAREMAMHYEAAGDWQRAARSLSIAAGHARERGVDGEAEELLTHALRMAENLGAPVGTAVAAEIRGVLAQARGSAEATRSAFADAAKA